MKEKNEKGKERASERASERERAPRAWRIKEKRVTGVVRAATKFLIYAGERVATHRR